jgi:hypothetical protein
MIRVGLVGEDPNDTLSLKNLLEKKYSGRILFLPLVERIRGFQLDNKKTKKALPIEFKSKKCNFIIYIRDLDGLPSEKNKILKRIQWFTSLDSLANNQGILLLCIWELEALLFADIDTINSHYRIKHRFKGNPMFLKEPKEELMRLTKHTNNEYKESHSPSLFLKLNEQYLIKRCIFYKEFIEKLEERL